MFQFGSYGADLDDFAIKQRDQAPRSRQIPQHSEFEWLENDCIGFLDSEPSYERGSNTYVVIWPTDYFRISVIVASLWVYKHLRKHN